MEQVSPDRVKRHKSRLPQLSTCMARLAHPVESLGAISSVAEGSQTISTLADFVRCHVHGALVQLFSRSVVQLYRV